MIRNINCPHCKKEISFRKNKKGKIVGTLVGGGLGYGLTSGLGIAGAIFGISVALPATLVGVGVVALIGNQFGKDFDNSQLKCPSCKKKLNF